MDTPNIIIYKLSKELDHKSGNSVAPHEHALPHRAIAEHAEEMKKNARFVLEKHGIIDDSEVYIQPFLPVTLENGHTALLGLKGHKDTRGTIEYISCIVSVKNLEMNNVELFKVTDTTVSWWDKRGVSGDDLPFMSAVVGEIYNYTFVPAGE